jgi:hypothetical protein
MSGGTIETVCASIAWVMCRALPRGSEYSDGSEASSGVVGELWANFLADAASQRRMTIFHQPPKLVARACCRTTGTARPASISTASLTWAVRLSHAVT